MTDDVVNELIVAVRPEGLDETQDGLDDVEKSFDDTSENVGGAAENMEKFATKFRGAMKAVMGALTVAATGLLAKVPVLSELFSGLVSVLEAVSFQMDSVLRPVLTPLTEGLFDLSAAIFNAEGKMGTFIGVLGTVVGLLGIVAGVVLVTGKALGALIGGFGTMIAVGKVVVGAVAAIVAAIGAVPLIIAGAIAALALLAWHFREPIVDAIKLALEWIGNLAAKGINILLGWRDDLVRLFGRLTTRFRNAGKAFINSLIQGLRDRIGALKRAANRVAQAVRDRLPGSNAKEGPLSDLDQTGPAFVDTFVQGIEANVNRAGSAADSVASGAASGDPAFAASRSEQPVVYLDGSRVDENQSKYQRGRMSRRGR